MAGAVDLYMSMLFVDQGMGNLISLTAPGTPNDVRYNALIDLGTTRTSRSDDTVEFVFNVLSNNGTTNVVIDLVVISHKDDDHWSLFDDLLDRIATGGKTLRINKLCYGDDADNYEKRYIDKHGNSVSVIERLKPYATSSPGDLKNSASAYSAKKPLANFDSYGGVRFVPVVANIPTTRKSSKDIVANTKSIVMAVLYLNTSIILPGDATAETLFAINELMNAGGAIDEIKQPFMLGIPHHGALRTLASNYKSTNPRLDVAGDFASEIDPWNVGASAGFESHHHPDESVIDLFGAYVKLRPKAHPYVCYSRNLNQWLVKNTKEGIFTTYLSIGFDGRGLGADKYRVVFITYSDAKSKIGIIPVTQAGLPPT